MLAVSALNTISSLILKALSDDSISDEEYSLILLEFKTFTRMKENLRIKSKTSLKKLVIWKLKLVSYLIEIQQLLRLQHVFKTMFKSCLKPCLKPCSKPCFKNKKKMTNKKHVISKNYRS